MHTDVVASPPAIGPPRPYLPRNPSDGHSSLNLTALAKSGVTVIAQRLTPQPAGIARGDFRKLLSHVRETVHSSCLRGRLQMVFKIAISPWPALFVNAAVNGVDIGQSCPITGIIYNVSQKIDCFHLSITFANAVRFY